MKFCLFTTLCAIFFLGNTKFTFGFVLDPNTTLYEACVIYSASDPNDCVNNAINQFDVYDSCDVSGLGGSSTYNTSSTTCDISLAHVDADVQEAARAGSGHGQSDDD